MGPEILHALLWLLRTSVRCGRAPIHAAHGYADPAYRPPRLPFASVIGPLMVDIEPQRDARAPALVMFQLPGHVIGHARAPGQVVAGGGLKLRFDGDAVVTVGGLAGAALSSAAAAGALARSIEQALITAVEGGSALGLDGTPVPVARRAELANLTVRWDEASRRFAVSTGRRGVADGQRRSSVEVLPLAPGADMAGDLGIADAASVDGRLLRHQLPVPRAMMLDVRIELSAASQLELAAVIDDLNRRLPGRGNLLSAPALLAGDGKSGASTIRLLTEGEPIGRHAWLQLEAADSIHDRVSDRAFTAVGSLDRTADRLRFDGASRALTAVVSPLPLVPSPLDPAHPAPRGLALAVGLTLAAGAVGQSARIGSLDHQGLPVIRLEVAFAPGNGGEAPALAEIIATATFQQAGGATAAAITRWRVAADRLAQRTAVHAAVVASKGTVELYLDGLPQPGDALAATPPTTSTGLPFAGNDMIFTVGDRAGNALSFDVAWAHLLAEPSGAVDPRLRRSIAGPSQWPAGRRITLASAEDGRSPGKMRHDARVVSVEGDVLTLAPPLQGDWPRGRTIVFAEEHFLQQQHIRRKDDLLNHIYRATGEYRVSALLEDDVVESAVPVVEIAEVELHAAAPVRAPQETAAGTRA